MTILTSITIIVCVLIISITNIISGYFKPEVILDKRRKVYKIFDTKLKSLINSIDIDIRNGNNISKGELLDELQRLEKIISKL